MARPPEVSEKQMRSFSAYLGAVEHDGRIENFRDLVDSESSGVFESIVAVSKDKTEEERVEILLKNTELLSSLLKIQRSRVRKISKNVNQTVSKFYREHPEIFGADDESKYLCEVYSSVGVPRKKDFSAILEWALPGYRKGDGKYDKLYSALYRSVKDEIKNAAIIDDI